MSNPFRNCLENIPLGMLTVGALMLGLAPFAPQPHLLEKLGMLMDGSLSKPIDIFDLLMHGALPALLLAKVTCLLRAHLRGRAG